MEKVEATLGICRTISSTLMVSLSGSQIQNTLTKKGNASNSKKTHRIPNKMYSREPAARHSVIKMSKIKDRAEVKPLGKQEKNNS